MGNQTAICKSDETVAKDKQNVEHRIVLNNEDDFQTQLRNTIKNDPLITEDLYNKLKNFKQKHIMENFNDLLVLEKKILVEDCITLDFLQLDFVFHHLLQKGLEQQKQKQTLKVDNVYNTKEQQKQNDYKKIYNKGLDIVARGQGILKSRDIYRF